MSDPSFHRLAEAAVFSKGLNAGYLALAIMIATEEIFRRFDGSAAQGRALAYGHSYSGNPLACAATNAYALERTIGDSGPSQ